MQFLGWEKECILQGKKNLPNNLWDPDSAQARENPTFSLKKWSMTENEADGFPKNWCNVQFQFWKPV